MNKTTLHTALLTIPVVTGAFAASAVLSPVAAEECNAETDLQGTVTRNQATVTNHSTNDACVYDATFASYNSPKDPETTGWIEAQTLHDSKTVKVKAGETVTLTVKDDVPACFVQTDLVRTDKAWEKPYYRTAMDIDVYKVKDNCAVAESKTPVQLAQTGDSLPLYAALLAGIVTLFSGLLLRKVGK